MPLNKGKEKAKQRKMSLGIFFSVWTGLQGPKKSKLSRNKSAQREGRRGKNYSRKEVLEMEMYLLK